MKYSTPEFEVMMFEAEDIITASPNPTPVDGLATHEGDNEVDAGRWFN